MVDADGMMPFFLAAALPLFGNPVGAVVGLAGFAIIALIAVNTPTFQSSWEILWTDAADAVSSLVDSVAASIEATKSKSVAKAETESKAEDTTLPVRKPHQYFGAEISNGSLQFITGPMDFDTAVIWVNSQAAFGYRSAGSLWGVYTLLEKDAKDLGNYFKIYGRGDLIYHPAHSKKSTCNPPFFDHYHIPGGLYEYFQEFHLWYGVAM